MRAEAALKTFVINGPNVQTIAAAPTGSYFVASFDDSTVRIFNAANRQTARVFKGHQNPAYGLAWSPDGALIASGDEAAYLYLWSPHNGQVVGKFRNHTKGIMSISFHGPHGYLVSDGRDDFLNIDNVGARKLAFSIPGAGANLYGAKYDPKLPYIAAGDLAEGARLYKSVNGQIVRKFVGHGNQGVLDIDFSPNGKLLATAGRDGTAIVWNVLTGAKVITLTGATDWVTHVAFAPNGSVVATSSVDRHVRLYDIHSGKIILDMPSTSGVGAPLAFTADGRYLLSSNEGDQLTVTALSVPLSGSPEAPEKHSRRRIRHRRR